MHRHILLRHLADQGFVSFPQQFGNSVPPANICHQCNQRLICFVAHRPIRRAAVVGHLNGHRPAVVFLAACGPAPLLLRHVQGNASVGADAVIAAGLGLRPGKQRAAALHRQIPRHAVNGDGVDIRPQSAAAIGAQPGIADQFTAAHGPSPDPVLIAFSDSGCRNKTQ